MSGCTTSTPDIILSEEPKAHPPVVVLAVPFVAQNKDHCGPAALAMVAQFNGKPLSQAEAAELVMTPQKNGSFPMDMIGAGRRLKFEVALIDTLEKINRSIRDGNPVIALVNLRFDWWPQWHYMVIVGYDMQANEYLIHSSTEEYKRQSIASFNDQWSAPQKWAATYRPSAQWTR